MKHKDMTVATIAKECAAEFSDNRKKCIRASFYHNRQHPVHRLCFPSR